MKDWSRGGGGEPEAVWGRAWGRSPPAVLRGQRGDRGADMKEVTLCRPTAFQLMQWVIHSIPLHKGLKVFICHREKNHVTDSGVYNRVSKLQPKRCPPNVLIKFHWNMVLTIHLRIVYGHFLFVTETVLPEKPKIFTIWIFIEKVCWFQVCSNSYYQ